MRKEEYASIARITCHLLPPLLKSQRLSLQLIFECLQAVSVRLGKATMPSEGGNTQSRRPTSHVFTVALGLSPVSLAWHDVMALVIGATKTL